MQDKDLVSDSNVNDELATLETHRGDFKGYTYIIPLDAPLPVDLESAVVSTGNLYQRIAPLAEESVEDIALVPLSGLELQYLDKIWPFLVVNKKMAVLTELPGATYDITFDIARKGHGLQTVDWPAISDAVAAREIKKQRTSDKEPWHGKDVQQDEVALSEPTQTGLSQAQSELPIPDDEYENR